MIRHHRDLPESQHAHHGQRRPEQIQGRRPRRGHDRRHAALPGRLV